MFDHSTKKKLISLIEKALVGNLSNDEYRNVIHDIRDKSLLVSTIEEDVADAIQHFPVHIFSGKPDFKVWESMYEYVVIYLDLQLLMRDFDEDMICTIRGKILEKKKLTKQNIDVLIKESIVCKIDGGGFD